MESKKIRVTIDNYAAAPARQLRAGFGRRAQRREFEAGLSVGVKPDADLLEHPGLPDRVSDSHHGQLRRAVPGAAGRGAGHRDAAPPELLLRGGRRRRARPALRRGDEHQGRPGRLGAAAATSACCGPASTTPASSGTSTSRRSWPTACRISRTSPSRRSSAPTRRRPSAWWSWCGNWAATARPSAAALLAKCDLTTEMVKEFTELQGVVGGLYARAQGEPEAVWRAIYEHYKPASMEDSIPRHREGRLVSLADKLDTLRGCFGVGLIPSGSSDPFALRRAAQGVVKILVEGGAAAAFCPLSSETIAAAEGVLPGPRPLLLPRGSRLPVRRGQRRRGRGLGRPGGRGEPAGRASRPCARRRISSRWPPASSASATSWSRRDSRRAWNVDGSAARSRA